MTTSLETYIDEQAQELGPLNKHINELVWQVSTTGKAEFEQQLGVAMQDLRQRIADPARHGKLRELMKNEGVSMTTRADELLMRQAKLLDNQFRANQMPPELIAQITALEIEIQGQFVKFRATVEDKPVADNDLRELLASSDDAELRQEAWEASKQIGVQVSDSLRQLAHLRNAAARHAGYRNYYAMRLETDELDEREVFKLFDDLKRGIDPAWQQYKGELDAALAKRFHTTVDQLRPWHYADPFFQEPQPSGVNLDPYFAEKDLEQLTRDYFTALGMDIDPILKRSDLYEREGKEQHAFCTDIDRAGDIRVLCNNRPNLKWMETMLHEFGHAVYDQYIDPDLPYWLRDPAHVLTTEAVAILSGDLVNDAEWLARYAGVPKDEAQKLEAQLSEDKRTARLIFARWVFVMTHFERALYNDPDQDLNTLWWNLVEEFQGVRRPEGRNAPDWAAKIHFSIAPAYYHNYLMGAMIAAQLRDYMVEKVVEGSREAYVGDPRIGRYMIERLFQPGNSRDWRNWLFRATGQGLSAAAYAKRLS